ncbi:MAG: hypothetical protein AB7U92_18445 [Piscinibacter sp.]|uniref:hypothetical protein n=1 Tax=Piscinibacter sp. TaxID=1903157 RepID=UPI003D0C7107
MPNDRRIVLATPHSRHDALEVALASKHGFSVLRIRDRGELSAENLKAHAPSHLFFPHWSWKIPPEVWQGFTCVVFHMTDLPFGRGGTPLQNLIVRGIEDTKLSALLCTETLDAGPVYLKRPLSLLGSAEEVLLRAAALMESMIVEIVERDVRPQPQTGAPVLFQRRTPDQGDLSTAETLEKVHDIIRMLDADGYPRAFIEIGRLRLEFGRASRRPDVVLADVSISLIPERDDT